MLDASVERYPSLSSSNCTTTHCQKRPLGPTKRVLRQKEKRLEGRKRGWQKRLDELRAYQTSQRLEGRKREWKKRLAKEASKRGWQKRLAKEASKRG